MSLFVSGQQLPPGLMEGIRSAISQIEVDMKEEFGCPDNPLLLSVRSGAAVSTVYEDEYKL